MNKSHPPLVQGQIGYYTNRDGSKRWKHSLRQKTRVSESSRSSYFIALENSLEDLKNCSKQGRVKDAIICLRIIQKLNLHNQKKFCLIRFLFYPDLQGKSALYYAAHSGQCVILEFYLSLFLMYSKNISSNFIKESKTFWEWFQIFKTHQMGLKKSFDYDLCVLNTFSTRVRHVMNRKKVCVTEAISNVKNLYLRYKQDPYDDRSLVNGRCFIKDKIRSSELEIMRVSKTRKTARTKRTLLNNSDVLFNRDDHLERIDKDYECPAEEESQHIDASDFGTMYSKIDHHAFINECIKSGDDVITGSAEQIIVLEEDNGDHSEIEWNVMSNDFSLVSIDTASRNMIDSEEVGIDEEAWDIISNVQSVQSLNTLSSREYSYRDALISNQANKRIKHESFQKIELGMCHSSKDLNVGNTHDGGKEYNINPPFRCFSSGQDYCGEDMRDEYKMGRGGERRNLFKGNKPTDRVTRGFHKSVLAFKKMQLKRRRHEVMKTNLRNKNERF
mmetsp:Transcript_53600/g.62635  ORF Transcript_53600/g.62635 Transcript_53600/m.62635 type:complete len:501 (-) Transcript_53600:253-1755(-)